MNVNSSIPRAKALALAACVIPLVVLLGMSTFALSDSPSGLESEAIAHLDQTGVSNPVTAVLLNYRSFDTLLEVAVLLVALLGARSIVNAKAPAYIPDAALEDTVLKGFVRIFAPIMVVAAGYMLWVGAEAPGGAFQAGAILATVGGVLWLSDSGVLRKYTPGVEAVCLVVGPGVFLFVGVAVMLPGNGFLEYPEAWAKTLILIVEAACTISIAAILFALFRAGLISRNAKAES